MIGSIQDAWEEITQLRVRLRQLQQDVLTLGERLYELQQEAEASRPRIVVIRPGEGES
jgi:hypothetical protein